VSQDDERELSEIGRSIDALFTKAEEFEEAVADPSGSEAQPQSEVAVTPDVGGQVDADTEPNLTPEAGPLSQSVETPVEPEPTPVGLEPAPAEPEPTPVEPEPTPVEPEPTPVESEAAPVEPEPTPAESEPTPVEPEPTQSEVGKVLSEATSDYLQAPVGQREEVQSALRSAVEVARSARALDEIASTVDILLLQASWDEDVEDLVGELVDGNVSAQMVIRLGRVQDEEERARLIQAYATLGDRLAVAIADALTDTEDRLARKTYVAALGAFGSAGAHAVEKMLKDSRWFVVRNGVAVLGVVAGPDAIEHLTASLANEHPGVRRETVRSLAKIGGENAGLLVSSMLGDSDPEVRAEAARAASALKAERAYKPLMEILKQGDEDEVIEQVLRALGGLGDASAVSAIEKRVKGSMFSSPPTGVRIAGLSALAAIGTPHAMSLVKKARNDKDPEVSSAAAQLLAGN